MRQRAPPKLCKDCISIAVEGEQYDKATCTHSRMQNSRIDLVSGEVLAAAPLLCSYARGVSTLCGTHGRHYMQRLKLNEAPHG